MAALHAQEQRLRTLEATNVLFLRPGSFFENFYASLEIIKHQGVNGDSVAPGVRLPMIATRDIADTAAEALRARKFEGFVVRELLGPRDLSYAEATAIVGERIGRIGLEYVQLPDEEMVSTLVRAGFSENTAGLHVEMTRAFNAGIVVSREGRKPVNSTVTRFEDFATDLVQAYEAA